MKKANSRNIVLGMLGIATVLSIGGAVSSTLAWYAYATRAALLYSGTSVFDNGQLEIGVKSSNQISELVGLGMKEETHGDSYYYFAPAGEGLSSTYMNAYLSARGYASDTLMPVTSGRFDREDSNCNTHHLLTAPNSEVRNPDATHNLAPIATYSQITFAFKTFRTNAGGERVYVSGQELWLTYVQTRASQTSSGNVVKAMRMYINRDETYYGANNGFIFNPSVEASGATKVGGLLNLGYDETYDFDDNGGYDETYDFDDNGEIIYGDYSIKSGAADDGASNAPYAGEDLIWDVNNKWDWESKPNNEQNQKDFADTFTATHSPSASKYYANLDNLDIKTAKYLGTDDVVQTKDNNGILANPEGKKTSVCKTGGESVGYIGEFDATIYLEGWDFSVIDEEQSHKFDFQLRFETNRI